MPEVEPTAQTDRDRRRLVEGLGEVAGIATVLGLICYAVLNVVCTAVYAPLHVSPQDVGLGYNDMLSRAAVAALGLVAGVLALLLLFIPFPGLLGVPRFGGWFERAAPRKAKWSLVAFLLVVSAVYVVGAFGLWPSAVGVAVVIIFFVAGGVGAAGLLLDPPRWAPRRRAVVLSGLALMVLVPSVGWFVFRAFQGSHDLQQARRPSRIAFNLPAPWTAEVVRVIAMDAAVEGLKMPICLLWLGQADGTTVLYDARPGHERALHVPTDSLLLEVLPNSKSAIPPERPTNSPGEAKSSCD